MLPSCSQVHLTKAYLVAGGQRLSTAGGRLLDRVLAQESRFTLEEVIGPDADAVVRDSAAYLIDFLCEVGVLRAGGPDGTYLRATGAPLEGRVSCVVCGGEWPIGNARLASLARSICLAPSFLAVLRTLEVVGICPACRVV